MAELSQLWSYYNYMLLLSSWAQFLPDSSLSLTSLAQSPKFEPQFLYRKHSLLGS